MKISIPSSGRRAFTLIELLVVIVIIAILVSLSVPVYNLIMAKTNTMKIKSTMQSVLTGVGHYYTEYNRFPIDPGLAGSGDADAEPILTDGTGGNKNPISILMDRTDTSSPNLNARRIKFVDIPLARNRLFGVVDPSNGADGPAELELYDMWGQPYSLLFDTSYDNRIANPDTSNVEQRISSTAPDNLTSRAVMYSNGPDKTQQTKDDVASWR